MENWFANWGQVGQLILGIIALFKGRRPSPPVQLPAPTTSLVTVETNTTTAQTPDHENNITRMQGGIARRTCAVGDFWQHSKFVKIIVRKLVDLTKDEQFIPGSPEHGAELEFAESVFEPGRNVKRGSTQIRLILPETPDTSVAPNCAYSVTLSMGILLFTVVRVTHINPHANQVELEVCKVTGRLPDY